MSKDVALFSQFHCQSKNSQRTGKPMFVNFNAHRNRNNRKASASPAQEIERTTYACADRINFFNIKEIFKCYYKKINYKLKI
jgi:hypothetical protein